MTDRNVPLVTRGRPRDSDLDRRITASVLELLAQDGYDAVSFEAVARCCQASKAALYRRWSSKRDMVLAAIKNGPARHASVPLERGTCLRDDLLALVSRLARTLRAADTGTFFMLLQAGLEDPGLCDAIEGSVGPTGARLPDEILHDAIAREELPPGANGFAYEEVVGSVLLLRQANGLTLDDAYLASLVDGIVIPALIASATQPGLPDGIFSGHPQQAGAICRTTPTSQENE